jgi:hypothetical protein
LLSYRKTFPGDTTVLAVTLPAFSAAEKCESRESAVEIGGNIRGQIVGDRAQLIPKREYSTTIIHHQRVFEFVIEKENVTLVVVMSLVSLWKAVQGKQNKESLRVGGRQDILGFSGNRSQ